MSSARLLTNCGLAPAPAPMSGSGSGAVVNAWARRLMLIDHAWQMPVKGGSA